MRKRLFVIFVVLLLFVSACSTIKDRTFQLTETYSLTSLQGTTSFLQINLPMSYGYQQVSEIRTTADTYDITEEDGYQVFNTQLQGDGSQKTVELTYTVTLLSGAQTWNDTTVKE